MAQTVIGIFESSSKAQEAVRELEQLGISNDRIDVSTGSYGSSGTVNTDDDHHESGIARLFKNLFGNDDDDADKYTRVASNAQSIVTVHAQSADEAERVADILDDNGAVDVDDHASRLGYNRAGSYSGTTGTSDYSGSTLATDTTTGLASVGGTTGLTGRDTSDYTDTESTRSYTGAGTRDVTGTDTSDLTGTTDLTGAETTGYQGTGTTGYSGAGTTGYTDNDLNLGNTTNDEARIPIIEENMEVGKREVRTGGVRLRSRIIERPVEEFVRLREERVNIERNTVDRPATAADLENFQERDIEMVERAEVPVVNKEARVVEEVTLEKEVEERNETIQDTVRRTEVDVENLNKDDLANRSNTRSDTSDL